MSDATLYINDVDKTSNLVRYQRIDEYCSPGQRVEIAVDTYLDVVPWDDVVLYEYGTKVFKGTINQVDYERSQEARMIIRAKDNIRRLREWFIPGEYKTNGETVSYWIGLLCSDAGCTLSFDGDRDPVPLQGMTIGRMFAWEAIDELLLFAGMDIWCDVEGVIHVGYRMAEWEPSHDLSAGTNLVALDRSQDSEPPKNAALCYAVVGYALVQGEFGWEIDDNDIRTMVVSSMYIENIAMAWDLAMRMLAAAGPTYDIKRCDLDDVYPEIAVGDRVSFDDGAGNSGYDDVTQISSNFDAGSGMRQMNVVLGERCPKVGAGFSPIDGRDVIVATYESGVWRCYDIWAATGPMWYPINGGLTDTLAYPPYTDDLGSGFKCEWFIRDPFKPDTAFLLNEVGVFHTISTEYGFAQWIPVQFHCMAFNELYDETAYIKKIRSTVAGQGVYYAVVSRGAYETYVMCTNDGFGHITWGKNLSVCDGVGPEYPPHEPSGSDKQCLKWARLWGSCNYGEQMSVSIGSWHRAGGYVGAQHGGLAAWHKNDKGCTASGIQSAASSNGGPAWWNCDRVLAKADESASFEKRMASPVVTGYSLPGCRVQPNWWCCFGIGGPLDPAHDTVAPTLTGSLTGGTSPWTHSPALHIPYKQKYEEDKPTVIYFHPGYWEGTHAGPTLGSDRRLIMPWGDDESLANGMQGGLGTYTPNPDKIYYFSRGRPSRFAIGDDGPDSIFVEKASVPFHTSCYSGFPYHSGKVYAGRHPVHDPSSGGDTALLYVSWDRGDTFVDVTGDLWEKTRLLGKRGGNLGTKGLVTIAPRYA